MRKGRRERIITGDMHTLPTWGNAIYYICAATHRPCMPEKQPHHVARLKRRVEVAHRPIGKRPPRLADAEMEAIMEANKVQGEAKSLTLDLSTALWAVPKSA